MFDLTCIANVLVLPAPGPGNRTTTVRNAGVKAGACPSARVRNEEIKKLAEEAGAIIGQPHR